LKAPSLLQSPTSHRPAVFISYRRADATIAAKLLKRILDARWGKGVVFLDEQIAGGVDFVDSIGEALSACSIVIALVGKHWEDSESMNRRGRLFHPSDWIRREISYALDHEYVVIPVLLDRQTPPLPESLPDDLKKLSRLHYMSLTTDAFDAQAHEIARHVEDATDRLRWSLLTRLKVHVTSIVRRVAPPAVQFGIAFFAALVVILLVTWR